MKIKKSFAFMVIVMLAFLVSSVGSVSAAEEGKEKNTVCICENDNHAKCNDCNCDKLCVKRFGSRKVGETETKVFGSGSRQDRVDIEVSVSESTLRAMTNPENDSDDGDGCPDGTCPIPTGVMVYKEEKDNFGFYEAEFDNSVNIEGSPMSISCGGNSEFRIEQVGPEDGSTGPTDPDTPIDPQGEGPNDEKGFLSGLFTAN